MHKPQITVGIPSYNAEKYLKLAIDSVLRQTFTDFELLLVNDGSTDGTLEILNQYQDKRIRVVNDGQNRGLIHRLNQMVSLAQGPYFVRMDADDVMFPNRLERQLAVLKNHPEASLCHSSAISIDRQNRVLGIKMAGKVTGSAAVLSGIFPIHPTVMGQTDFFRANPYREGFFQMEDMELWYRTADKYTFKEIEEPLLFYREDSIKNSSKHRKMYAGLEKFASEYISDPRQAAAMLNNSMRKRRIYEVLEFFRLEKFLLSRRFARLDNAGFFQALLNELAGSGEKNLKAERV